VIHLHPLGYLMGLEGVALLRAFSGAYDREFTDARLREIRDLLDSADELGPGVDVRPMSEREVYAGWADSYDRPGNQLLEVEQPIVREILDGLPVGVALDAGCGTGRHAAYLASLGHRVIGVDASPEMLAEARRRAEESRLAVEFRRADMRDFDLGERFRLAFVAGNSLLHLHETEDLIRCFTRVRDHLEPDGWLVFDVFNPSVRLLAEAAGERRERTRFVDPERGEVRVEVRGRYDAAAQVMREVWFFSSEGEADFVVAPLELRSIFPRELPLLLGAGGFRLEARFGDFARRLFGSDSPHQVCFCRPVDSY
jgi:SAM-dependent methyltransferase